MTSTKTIIEKLGGLLFFAIFFGLPFLVFDLYYQGRSVGNWFGGMEWYETGSRITLIVLALIVYCLFMYGIRYTIFEPMWAKTVGWYESKALQYGKGDLKDGTDKVIKGKKNDMDNKTHAKRRNIFQRGKAGNAGNKEPSQPQRDSTADVDKISDATGVKPPTSV